MRTVSTSVGMSGGGTSLWFSMVRSISSPHVLCPKEDALGVYGGVWKNGDHPKSLCTRSKEILRTKWLVRRYLGEEADVGVVGNCCLLCLRTLIALDEEDDVLVAFDPPEDGGELFLWTTLVAKEGSASVVVVVRVGSGASLSTNILVTTSIPSDNPVTCRGDTTS